MDSFETDCRRLIDGLVHQLVALASEVAEEQLRTARAEREAAEPRVSPRIARALERAEERRRLAAERRAAVLAARAARAQKHGPDGEASGRSRLRAPAEAEPAKPAPLFVHKRSRDGSIQKLERAQNEQASALPV
jgi:hypothetical protein